MECGYAWQKKSWGGTEQRLEANLTQVCNAITTVQKDTLVLEKMLDSNENKNIIADKTRQDKTRP